jgi:tetratricopeptide (TPR) repeat protein
MLKMAKIMTAALSLSFVTVGAEAQIFLQEDNVSYERAAKAMQAGNYTTASKLFRRAIKGNLRGERLVSAYNNLCAIEYSRGEYERAEKACDEALTADKTYWLAYANRANVREARGNLAQALADRQAARVIAPEKELEQRVIASIVHHKW